MLLLQPAAIMALYADEHVYVDVDDDAFPYEDTLVDPNYQLQHSYLEMLKICYQVLFLANLLDL